MDNITLPLHSAVEHLEEGCISPPETPQLLAIILGPILGIITVAFCVAVVRVYFLLYKRVSCIGL